MSASYTLPLDARRCALLTSSYSPRLSDASQFPLSAILAKLPSLPDSPALDAPEQPGVPTPPTSPTSDIALGPLDPTIDSPAVNGLGLDYDDDLPQASGSGSDSGRSQAQGLRQAFETHPLAVSDNGTGGSSDSGRKNLKRFLGSRAIAWWTRFSKRG